MLLEGFMSICLLTVVTSLTCYKSWLGHNGASAVLNDYRYFMNEVDCISKESVCALYVWRSTGHTNYTIASSDCVANYDECKNV
ncbi:hypothetical protein ANCCAN_00601, partial [Ancylostoma caninum]